MATIKYKQDLPPVGGYKDIFWKRKPPPALLSSFWLWGTIGFYAIAGMWFWRNTTKRREALLRFEMQEARTAVWPFYEAEMDRMKMKQLRRNREWETELMKDVPGWEVGTIWGEPVYHNKHNVWNPIPKEELYAHVRLRDFQRRCDEVWYRQ